MRKLGLAAAASICLFTALQANAQTNLVIGFSLAKTGPFVSNSITNEIAADIAVDEINSKGGINGKKVLLEKFDTGGNPKQAQVSVTTLANDKHALAVVGPFSTSEVRVAFPAGDRLGIVQTSMASSAPGVAKSFKFAFRNTTDEERVVSSVLSQLKKKNIATRSSAIAYAMDDALSKASGTGVMPGLLAKANLPVTMTVDFQLTAFDLSPQVSQLKQAQPDILGVAAPPEAAIKLAKELRRQNVTTRIIGGTMFADPDLPKRLEGAAEGLTTGVTYYKGANEGAKRFAAEFEKRTKAAGMARNEPNQYDAGTHSIVMLYAEAMRRAKVTGEISKLAAERDAIRKELIGLKDFPTIEGNITFNQDKDVNKPIYVMEHQKGEWVLLGTEQ